MTIPRIKTPGVSSLALPTFSATIAEQAIADTLSAWWEADYGVDRSAGFRWRDRLQNLAATVLNRDAPPSVVASHGNPALQTGYGSPAFSGTNRGAVRAPSSAPLLGTSAFTVYSVTRVPTVASGESAIVGGNVWSSRGAAGNNTPGLNISGSTGDPVFRAGGVTTVNPGAADLRDGLWHLIRCELNGTADTITVAIDGAAQVASVGGATGTLDASIPNMLAPIIGGYLNSNGTFSTPFYGQISAVLISNRVHTAGERSVIQSYLGTKYGISIT